MGQIKKVTQSPNESLHGQPIVQPKPQISEKSAKLAEAKRKKLLGDRENVSLVEILLIPKHNEADLESKRKQL